MRRKKFSSKNKQLTSSQDGGVDKHTLPPRTTTAKITTRLQNKYHPDLSANQAVWKSNIQVFKEAIFIQMGRRGRDTDMCREAWRDGEVQRGSEMWSSTDRGTFMCGG